MADSLAGLVYGINVRTCDLIAAGKAFAQVHPALIALHQIQRLRDKGTIRVEAGKPDGVERVPVEVWTMIEQSVVDCGVEDGRAEVAKEVICEECDSGGAELEAHMAVLRGSVKYSSEMLVAHFLFELKLARLDRRATKNWADEWVDFSEWDETCDHFGTEHWIDDLVPQQLESEDLTNLLATFGLHLPYKRVVTGTASDDISSLSTPLAVDDLQRSSGQRVITTTTLDHRAIGYHEPVHETKILDLPKSIFKLQPDTDSRFAKCLAKWHLTPSIASRVVRLSRHGREKEERLTEDGAVPRWMLVAKLRVEPY